MATPSLYRINQICGDPARDRDPIIPVSRATWWRGVKSGRFPQPIKLSANCTAWKAEEIHQLAERLRGEA